MRRTIHPHARPVGSAAPAGARFIGAVFGVVFLGIGVTVLLFLWGALGDDDGFGGPPLVFRLFGSFIALAFVAIGGTVAASMIFGTGGSGGGPAGEIFDEAHRRAGGGGTTPPPSGSPPTPLIRDGQYVCPNCGAALGARVDVSPLGDAKCGFCGSWFNIHGRKGG